MLPAQVIVNNSSFSTSLNINHDLNCTKGATGMSGKSLKVFISVSTKFCLILFTYKFPYDQSDTQFDTAITASKLP